MFFLFYALSPYSKEQLMAQVNIQPRVGVQLKVKAAAVDGREFTAGLFLNALSFLLNANV